MKREVKIIDSIYERIEADGLDGLTDPELFYFAIWWLVAETSNGTFHQYFSNSAGEFAEASLRGLQTIGAHRMAATFQAAIDLFPNSQVPKDRRRRIVLLYKFTAEKEAELEELSDAFTAYSADLRALLDEYVREHEADFRGPKTLLDQWHARRARGANTQPPGTFKLNLEDEAKKDAQTTDRKCPICAQPAPDYRKTCKRCGYPYGRVIAQPK